MCLLLIEQRCCPPKKCKRVPSNYHSLVKKCCRCGQLLKIKGRDGQWHIPPAPNDLIIITAVRRSYGQNEEQNRGQLGNVSFHCRDECEAYATSPSAFSGGHTQLSSTTSVTSSTPAPRTGITNSSLAGTTLTFVPPPPPMQEGAF